MMRQYKIRITPNAKMQLTEIKEYISNELQNPDAAKALLKYMKDEIKKLSNMPEKFKVIDEEPWGSQGIRKIIVKNFYVYYWIDSHEITVHIIAIAYGKRDQERVLTKVTEV